MKLDLIHELHDLAEEIEHLNRIYEHRIAGLAKGE